MTQTERELLEALKRLTNYTFDRSYCGGLKNTACHCTEDCPIVQEIALARAAIAKAEAEQAERVEPAKPVAWYIKEHGDIVDLEWDTNKPNTTWGDWKPLYTAPPAAALEGGTVASGNIVGAVASGNIVGAVASGNQLSGAHNIRSK